MSCRRRRRQRVCVSLSLSLFFFFFLCGAATSVAAMTVRSHVSTTCSLDGATLYVFLNLITTWSVNRRFFTQDSPIHRCFLLTSAEERIASCTHTFAHTHFPSWKKQALRARIQIVSIFSHSLRSEYPQDPRFFRCTYVFRRETARKKNTVNFFHSRVHTYFPDHEWTGRAEKR